MKSMTGYGRGTALGENGTQAVVELSAVNSRKQLEMRISAPKELGMLESELRAVIQKQLVRGTLVVSVSYQLGKEDMGGKTPLDSDYAVSVASQLVDFAKKSGLPMPTIGDVLSIPGVLKVSDTTSDVIKPLVFSALDKALKELDAMRDREGAVLRADLSARGEAMRALVDRIGGREQEAILLVRDKLRERIAQLGVELPIDDERLLKELAFYVDKSDITEEVVRLKSHLNQYAVLMDATGDAGRNLDFLCQEMSREVNTLSAKTSDMSISADAMALKIELSKIKEQIMNVE